MARTTDPLAGRDASKVVPMKYTSILINLLPGQAQAVDEHVQQNGLKSRTAWAREVFMLAVNRPDLIKTVRTGPVKKKAPPEKKPKRKSSSKD